MKLIELLDHLENGGRILRLGEPEVLVFLESLDGPFQFIWLGDSYQTKREWSLNLAALRCDDWVKAP